MQDSILKFQIEYEVDGTDIANQGNHFYFVKVWKLFEFSILLKTYLTNFYYLIQSIDVPVINLPNVSKVFVCFKYTLGAILHKVKTS